LDEKKELLALVSAGFQECFFLKTKQNMR